MAQNQPSAVSRQSSDRNTGYIPALDGLRAVAILLVVGSHAGLDRVVPGAFGVTLFFFISGYLITRQLLGSLAARGRIGLGGFYLRRVLRLAPAGLAYTLLAGLAYRWAGGRLSPLGWLAAVFYGANIFDLWVGYRSTLAGVRHPFNILWSLAIEEHFYAVWPPVLAAIWRWRAAVWAVLALCLAVLAWRLWLFGHCGEGWTGVCGRLQPDPRWRYNRLYLGTDTRFDSIAWGALLALAEQRRQAWVGSAARSRAVQAAAWAVLAGGFLLPGALARHVVRTTLQGAAMLVLFPAILHREHALRRALSTPPALLVGRLSYSLYLWHWGAFALADRVAGADRALWLAIGLPASVLGAGVSYVLVEQPMLRLRRRAGSHAPVALVPDPSDFAPAPCPVPAPQPFRRAVMQPAEREIGYLLGGGFHRLAFTAWGDPANRPVVCVHGLSRQGRDFDALAQALADRYHVICPDLPGRGRSSWLPDPGLYAPPHYAVALSHLLSFIDRPVDWVGTSLGGVCGMLLAAAPGTPIRRMVLNDIGPFLPKAALERIANYVGTIPDFADLAGLEAFLRQVHAPFGQLTDAQWAHMAAASARTRDDGQITLHYDPAMTVPLRQTKPADTEMWALWDMIGVPMLTIRGETSDLLLPETLARMAAKSATHTVLGTGHAPALMDVPTIEVVAGFLDAA